MKIFLVLGLAVLISVQTGEALDCYDDTKDPTGKNYRGHISVTEKGLPCQRWTSQSPNRHNRTPQNYPKAGLEENYCRNPDGEPRPWCYNEEGTKPRWQYCSIPKCSEVQPVEPVKPVKVTDCYNDKTDPTGKNYRGHISVTEKGLPCQEWTSQSPNKHNRTPRNYPKAGLEENYCRNPDGEPRPWCYNEKGTNPRWQYCSIPRCSDVSNENLGSRTLKLMCNDYATIYYDGVEQKNVAGTNNWNVLATSTIPEATKEVMVKCENAGGSNGIKAEILDAHGNVESLSGRSWRCSNKPKSDYKMAALVKNPTEKAWKNTLSSASVIWTRSSSVRTAYCKFTFPDPTKPKQWRDDGRCGKKYSLNDWYAECNPKGAKPCCTDWTDGHCDYSPQACDCYACVDYAWYHDPSYNPGGTRPADFNFWGYSRG